MGNCHKSFYTCRWDYGLPGDTIVKQYSLEEWRDMGRAFYDVRLKTDPRQFSARADFCGVNRLILTKVRFTPQLLAHDPANIREFDSDYLLFERYESGEGRGVLGGTATQVDSNTLHMLDMSQPYATSTSVVVGDGVLIPHDLVGFDPSRDPNYVSVQRSKPRARLLEAALDALISAIAEGSLDEARDLANAFAGLVQSLLLGRIEDTDLQSAASTLDLELRDHINTHLADPGLNGTDLCDRFGLSRASLYRRFQEEGGVEHYITGLRLDRCLVELSSAAPTRGRVRAIAERWRFTDPSNFNRRFRERFDVAPSECLALNETPVSTNANGGNQHLIHQWMRKSPIRNCV